jgi:glutamyl-tRNA synthetase
MEKEGAQFDGAPDLQAVIALMKERANTINELASAALLFYRQPAPDAGLLAQHVTEAVKPALAEYAERLKTVEWNKAALSALLKEVLGAHKLKMPQLAMPLRLMLTGQLQTPAIDAVIELFDRNVVSARLAKFLQ